MRSRPRPPASFYPHLPVSWQAGLLPWAMVAAGQQPRLCQRRRDEPEAAAAEAPAPAPASAPAPAPEVYYYEDGWLWMALTDRAGRYRTYLMCEHVWWSGECMSVHTHWDRLKYKLQRCHMHSGQA